MRVIMGGRSAGAHEFPHADTDYRQPLVVLEFRGRIPIHRHAICLQFSSTVSPEWFSLLNVSSESLSFDREKTQALIGGCGASPGSLVFDSVSLLYLTHALLLNL